MKFLHKAIGWALCLAAGFLVVGFFNVADGSTGTINTEVQVEIIGGDVCIFATWSFDFGTYTVSSTDQTVTGAFTDYFSVEDLKGSDSGYYTTLQLSGDLTGPGGATIGSGNVSAAVPSTGTDLITGTANALVEIPASLLNYSTLDTARTYIKRDPAANFWTVGHYGQYPYLQVVIPAFSAVGTYTGTLVYTLFDLG